MNNLEMILIYVGLAYMFFGSALILGLVISKTPKQKSEDNREPFVSIIIPARNEENNIIDCLTSISELNYPPDKIEVLVIDDNSTDRTNVLVSDHITGKPGYTLISLDSTNALGKTGGLIEGYKAAGGEIIFQTDADCTVPKNWISTFLKHFGEKVGIVGGMTLTDTKKNTIFEHIQSLDWMYLLGVGGGSNGIGVPLSCIGNNLAVRKKAYTDVGGYEKIKFSITEDFALFKAITSGGWKSGYSVEPGSLVMTKPAETLADLFVQRARWAAGGTPLAGLGLFLLVEAFAVHAFVPLSLFLDIGLEYTFYALAMTLIIDLVFLSIIGSKIKMTKTLKYFLYFEVYFYINTTVMGLLFPWLGLVKWKGRKLIG